ncbi:MBL fold metallo-hydrolase [Aliiglaciecola sp. CAU 1673]|uniref:MBL fold metallo-hydrolase n=1 Tax=Aliiglaciecola sp. CAU 1673 TaxID=3032595 RepID=UPI0023D9D999|nr:MBL fold metallo-hydrolase [Aliiglaciecola sp. CAU 1673]MDF2178631.1 MBL fold metallo-hydrolase [Aliiglaciecola sp. CAU 1673]
MKQTITLTLLALSVAISNASAENFTRSNVEKVRQITNESLSAYGGQEKLTALSQLYVDYAVTNINAGQSRKPEPPWDKTQGDFVSAIDFSKRIVSVQNAGEGGGGRFANTTLIVDDQGFQLDAIRKTISEMETPDFNQIAGPGIRVNSTLLLRSLQQNLDSARYLGSLKFAGKDHDLISFDMNAGPAITLYIDQATHLISKSERLFGDILVEYYFNDYRKVDGITLPYFSSYSVNGDPSQEFVAEAYKINQPLDAITKLPKDYEKVEATPAFEMRTEEVAPGVFWVINNFQNGLFVEFEDYVLAVGALDGVNARVDELRKAVKDKPIKYSVITHHHNDHIGGVAQYAELGAQLVTVKAHEKVIKDNIPDGTPQFLFVDGKKVFKDSKQVVEVIDIGPTPHTEHYLLTYLPEHGIIFDADHINVPAVGPMAPPTPNMEFMMKAIKEKGLKVKTIVSAHNPIAASFDKVQASLNVGH